MDGSCNNIFNNQNKKQKKVASDQGGKGIGPCQWLQA